VISVLTFPGVIIHEWGHALFCRLSGIPVYEIRYFRFGNPAGYVLHGEVGDYGPALLICVAPLIVNTITAMLAFLVATRAPTSSLHWPLLWLGFSVAMHSFPSSGDASALWRVSAQAIRHNLLAVTGFPIVVLLKVVSFLRILCLDVIYAALLLWFVTSTFSS
jgi:hypothetical protein